MGKVYRCLAWTGEKGYYEKQIFVDGVSSLILRKAKDFGTASPFRFSGPCRRKSVPAPAATISQGKMAELRLLKRKKTHTGGGWPGGESWAEAGKGVRLFRVRRKRWLSDWSLALD